MKNGRGIDDIIKGLAALPPDEAKQVLERVDLRSLGLSDSVKVGAAAEQLGMLSVAIGAYNRALEIDRTCMDAMRPLANIRVDQGDWKRAERLLGMMANAGDKDAARTRVEVLLLAGQQQQAKAAMEHLPPEDQELLGEFLEPMNLHTGTAAQMNEVSDADMIALVDLFSARQGVHARQWSSPRRSCQHH